MQPASAPPTENATAAAPQKTRGLLNVSDDREVPLGTGSERASLAAESWLQYESRCVPLTPHPASARLLALATRCTHPLTRLVCRLLSLDSGGPRKSLGCSHWLNHACSSSQISDFLSPRRRTQNSSLYYHCLVSSAGDATDSVCAMCQLH